LLSKGLYTVSANHKVYYELHGSAEASERVVFISGLNMASWSFRAAAMHFAAVCTLVFPFTTQGEQLPGYQVLVLDNRGVGHSDSPTASSRLYKTSHMGMRLQYTVEDLILPASDVIDLMNHLGWTQPRSVTLVGVSMGGMIAQVRLLFAKTSMEPS
jgi:pimeloyl-ACP methyl ester carboxylesterase